LILKRVPLVNRARLELKLKKIICQLPGGISISLTAAKHPFLRDTQVQKIKIYLLKILFAFLKNVNLLILKKKAHLSEINQ